MTEAGNNPNPTSQDHNPYPLIRVIGIGSHHGADRIGWLACDRLQMTLPGERLDWQLCRNPVHLPQLVQDCECVVIIDALLSDHAAGQVINLTWPIQSDSFPSFCSTHGINVIQALQLAATLDQLPSRTYLLGLSVTDQHQDPTAVISRALPQLQQVLKRIINQIA